MADDAPEDAGISQNTRGHSPGRKAGPALPDRPPRGLAWGNRAPLRGAPAARAPAPLRAPRGTAALLISLVETWNRPAWVKY